MCRAAVAVSVWDRTQKDVECDWTDRRARHYLGTKMVDLRRMTSLLKRTLPAVAEAAKDCRVLMWNVRNMCETSGWFWICVGMVIAILTVLSGGLSANPISDDCPCCEWCGLRAWGLQGLSGRQRGPSSLGLQWWKLFFVWRLRGSCANSQITLRRVEVWWFHGGHDTSCETQLLELVSWIQLHILCQ